MGCFRISLTDPLQLLFYGLSLLQAFRALQLAEVIRHEWASVRQEPLTRRKAALAEQAAFFLAIPPSVAVHELFHAIPVWLFGGRIVECGYGFYWGFVLPDRLFPPTEQWLVALAGPLGSLLFGLGLWFILRSRNSSTIHYFGLRQLRTQLFYSLIFYPVFSAVTFIGDWRMIYDFPTTPVLSAGTAIFHLGALALFWHADRRGGFEMVSHETVAEQQQFAASQAETAVTSSEHAQLRYIDTLRRGGATNQARRHLQQFLRANPHSAAAHLQLAALQVANKAQIPRSAAEHAQKGLQLGLSDPRQVIYARQLVGRYNLDLGRNEQAINHLSQAIATMAAAFGVHEEPVTILHQAQLYQWRSQAYRRLGQHEAAHQDLRQAVILAEKAGDQETAATWREMLAASDERLTERR